MRARLLILMATLATASVTGCIERRMPENTFGLDCIFDFRQPVSHCTGIDHQQIDHPTTSNSRELQIQSMAVRRDGGSLIVDVDLVGRFFHDPDQNVYLFIGASTDASTPVTYTLTKDPTYFEDVGYPVRGAITFPHRNDVRIGIMSVNPGGYSPQVYLLDSRTAAFAGEGTQIVEQVEGSRVHLTVPVGRYYEQRGEPIPVELGVTVATARDYVGFIDQATATNLIDSEATTARGGDPTPAVYPTLDPDAHILQNVRLVQSNGGVSIEFDTRVPIQDWAQTNIHLFVIPVEPYPTKTRLFDPSHVNTIPYKWSYYCGVYSPHRVFCKASEGTDFTFDGAYSDRASLDPPRGVIFRILSGGHYAIELSRDTVRHAPAGRPTFAVMLSIGRDGFAPTSWYGASGKLEVQSP